MERLEALILAGGFGMRFSEKTKKVPKPMIKLGADPILMHIIKKYVRAGIKNFIIATGYKYNVIDKYFRSISIRKKKITKNSYLYLLNINRKKVEVKTIYTGLSTLTGTRILRMGNYINSDRFFLTYGDGLCDVNLYQLLDFHIKMKSIGTVTSVRPPARFGELVIKKNIVHSFKEKPQLKDGWINGGFFVFEKKFIKLINKNKNVMLERQPLETLTRMKKFSAFRHHGFWQCMDTLRDYNLLKKMNTVNAPWKK